MTDSLLVKQCACKHSLSRRNYLACFAATSFFFFEQVRVNMFNTLAPHLMKFFKIEAFKLGGLSAAYLLAIVLSLFPAGFLLDKYSIKKPLLFALSICIFASLLFFFSNSILLARISMFIAGIGCAFCFLGAIKLASLWFHPSKLGLIVGLIITAGMMGGMTAQAPLEILIQHLPWKSVFLFLIVGETLTLFIILLFMPKLPSPSTKTNQEDSKISSLPAKILTLISSSQNWFAGLCASFLNFPIAILGGIWGSFYLVQARGISEETASIISSMLFIGMIISSPLAGWISDKIKSRRIPILMGSSLAVINVFCLIYIKNPSTLALFLFFLFAGLLAGIQCIGYAIVNDNHHKSSTEGIAMSFVAILVVCGNTFMQPLFGWILDYGWSNKLIDSVPLYPAANYINAMLILPVGFILAVIISFIFLKESYSHIKDA